MNSTEGGNLPASQLCLLSAWLCFSSFQPDTLEIVEAAAHTDSEPLVFSKGSALSASSPQAGAAPLASGWAWKPAPPVRALQSLNNSVPREGTPKLLRNRVNTHHGWQKMEKVESCELRRPAQKIPSCLLEPPNRGFWEVASEARPHQWPWLR